MLCGLATKSAQLPDDIERCSQWTRADSNRLPLQCECSVLPGELLARESVDRRRFELPTPSMPWRYATVAPPAQFVCILYQDLPIVNHPKPNPNEYNYYLTSTVYIYLLWK